jgi:hypothetical protein
MNMQAPAVDGGKTGARAQVALRYATGTTGAFVVSEAFGWTPNFIGAVLAGAFLANLPGRPPLKLGAVLVLVMAGSSSFSFILSSLLRGTPTVLFGLVGLCMLLGFHAVASGKPMLPILLALLSLIVIPVIAMQSPEAAGTVPTSLTRGMLLAMLAVWATYAVWPSPPPKAPPPPPLPATATPLTLALLSTAVLLPLMLAYMLFGWVDVFPVLISTLIIVLNFDVARGQQQALALVAGNFAGGMFAILLYALFQSTPSLPFLALLLFLVQMGFGRRIAAGGPLAGVAVVGCNGMLIIFGSALGSNTPVSGWIARVFQFALAGAFALGALQFAWYLVLNRRNRRARRGST